MKRLFVPLLVIVLSISAPPTYSQDTELYVGNTSAVTSGRPKVLIIMDNSGSMNRIVPGTRTIYDPTITYPTQGNIQSDRIYWSKNGTPPNATTGKWLLADSNRCASSMAALSSIGTYTDYVSVWRPKKGKYRWRSVNKSSGARSSEYIECKTDVDNENASNPGSPTQADGYPLNSNSGPYTASYSSTNVKWSKLPAITLFSANYMNWYHDPNSAGIDRKRIDIAKEVVTNIIDSNPNVDFGLMVFNTNTSGGPHGGRVVQGISENMTDSQRITLKSTVTNISAETWTPLCETMYEAYRYFSGGAVYYGDDMSSPTPARDLSVENNGNYISPMGDCQQVYVILMTDGQPTYDTAANSLIGNLSGIGSFSGNRLDELAGWMYSNDLDNDDTNGVQRVVTYTIGFTIDQALLSDTASKGGGRYYTANDSAALTNSFQGALNEILITDTTFTSPAVAVNSFNRSRSLDDVYIAMFRPDVGPRWSGNLKKLTIDDTGTLRDANGVPAIDPTTGNIRDTARTHWSTAPDGGRVQSGGAGELLAARDPATRIIKVNSGTGGALEDFSNTNANLTIADFNAVDDNEKHEIISWARGVDVDNEDIDDSSTDTRPWLIGDPLHSQPLVINYGARSGYSVTNPDIRILMGTNFGVLHMFGADDGQEDWAFFPKELLWLHKVLRENSTSVDHPYGVDGSVTMYMKDSNSDGTINGSDKVYIYFGLRRGGDAYYAMDITDPDAPVFMWKIDASTAGLAELGQSWSTPQVTHIPGYTNPVLVVGGGYDTNKDASGVGTDDSSGRGVFIIDALTGSLVWSVTPAANSVTNLQHAGLKDSIPAPVTVFDANGDGLTDRIYVADTGGNVWRIDMPGSALPSADQTTWSIFKLADFGGTTTANDRRFFNQVDVVRTRYGAFAYDAVALGSGNRAHPNGIGVDDRFFMIRDTEVVSAYHGSGGVTVPDALTSSDLYDASANLIQQGNETEKTAAVTSLAEKAGWYIELERLGEKNLASSVTLNGTVYFTTFTPDSSVTSCVPIPGYGYLYAVNLHNAAAVFEWDATTPELTTGDRDTSVGGRLPDSVTPHFGEDTIRIIGVGPGDNGSGSYDTGGTLATQGIYWYKETQ